MARTRIGTLIAALLVSQGCYESHSLFGVGLDSAVVDAGSLDTAVPIDAPFFDGGLDSGLDTGLDAGFDAGYDAGFDAGFDSAGRDASPPAPAHPPPGSCRIEPEVEPFDDPVLETRWPPGPVLHSDAVHVSSTPLVIDLDPSGESIEPVVVFVSYPPLRRRPEPPGILRIWDPRTDTTISYPPDPEGVGVLEPTTNVAAGDIDGDGRGEIVGNGLFSGTYAFNHDGTLLWEAPYPPVTDRGDPLGRENIISGAPSLADLEGDGTVEVINGRTVLDGETGELIWHATGDTGLGNNQFFGHFNCVVDLDSDGIMEVIAGNTAYRADGEVYWQSPAPDGICAIAEMDASHRGPEVVLVSNGYVRLLDSRNGEQFWIRRLEGRVSYALGGAPTVADFDGDGRPEIGVAHGGAYGVYDKDCEGPGDPGRCTDFGLLWSATTSDASSSGTSSSVFDFNGDGRAEVVYNDEYYFRVYNGITGRPLFEHRNSSRTRTENPTIADVDNDGDAEIIFCANAEAFFVRTGWTDPGVEIWGDAFGRWVGARRIWNQHAYHITNVEEDGTIPAGEEDSWTLLNAYRQNLREGGDVLVVPDLWGGHGTYRCVGRGRAILRVEVFNWGLERVGAGVVIGFYRGTPAGGMRIGEARTTRTLEPRGDSEVVELEISLMDPVVDYYARLDDPTDRGGRGAVQECREGNNDVLIWRPYCP